MKVDQVIQEVTTSIIAIVLILGTLAIVAFQVVNNKTIAVPDVVIALDFAVGGLYFGNVSAKNGARQAGTAAAQTAVTQAQSGGGSTTSVPANPTSTS